MSRDEGNPRPPEATDPYGRIASGLAELGWCVTPDFLSRAQVSRLRREALRLWRQGAFRRAGVGRGADLRVRPEVRTDLIRWLDRDACTRAQRLYLEALEDLRRALNRSLFLGLYDFEGHLAVYPAGSFYRKHLDRFRGEELRTLSCVLYLNRDWSEGDGGALRLYTDPEDPSAWLDIPPIGGTLATFLSARFPHEVLPARRDRIGIAGWFRRRAAGPFRSRPPARP